eukprot:22721-Chlamydomonas_euryale.AAC.2
MRQVEAALSAAVLSKLTRLAALHGISLDGADVSGSGAGGGWGSAGGGGGGGLAVSPAAAEALAELMSALHGRIATEFESGFDDDPDDVQAFALDDAAWGGGSDHTPMMGWADDSPSVAPPEDGREMPLTDETRHIPAEPWRPPLGAAGGV